MIIDKVTLKDIEISTYRYKNHLKGGVPIPEIGHLVSKNHIDDTVDHCDDDVFEVIKIFDRGRMLKLMCLRDSNFNSFDYYKVGEIKNKSTSWVSYRKNDTERKKKKDHIGQEQIEMFNT